MLEVLSVAEWKLQVFQVGRPRMKMATKGRKRGQEKDHKQ
jgi:hypothetical protein